MNFSTLLNAPLAQRYQNRLWPLLPAPETLAHHIGRLPQAPLQKLATLGLQQLLKPLLARGELDFLDGKTLSLAISGSAVYLRFEILHQQLRSADRGAGNADVCIEADARALLHIAARLSDPDTLFFQRRLLITGDTELGLQLKNRLDAFEAPAVLQSVLLRAGEQWPLESGAVNL